MAKKKRRKATLHSAGKVLEADLLERARALHEDASLITPICDGSCVFLSPVASARKGIAKVFAARDDGAKLQKLARSGNELARAYASALLLASDGKVPYVAELKLPGMTASYVLRGAVKPFYAAGVLNYDDRQLRLLAVSKWVKKRKLHFYSADRGIVCTGKRDAPPRDFVEEEAALLGLEEAEPNRFTCGHKGDRLVIRWRSANATFERCRQCFDDLPTLVAIAQHTAVPEALSKFDVEAVLTPLSGAGAATTTSIPASEIAAYKAGQRTDGMLLDAARSARTEGLRSGTGRVFIAGDKSFGDDANAFIATLNATRAEEVALRAALKTREKPVVLDKPTTARALAELWPEHGLAMLEAVAGDAAVAQRIHKERIGPDEATELVRRADREGAHGRMTSTLPTYAKLPTNAATADAIARAFRSHGKADAARAATERAASGKGKGVALAFLNALGVGKGQEWRFTQQDAETAAALAPAVNRLLNGAPEAYHEALREASLLTGETADF